MEHSFSTGQQARSYKMTKSTYTVTTTNLGESMVLRQDTDGTIWNIPVNEANSDYQAYLATLASELSNPSTPQAGE